MGSLVALATAAKMPELDEDGPGLIAALAACGIEAVPAVWDDPAVDWERFGLVLIRSTWDYTFRPGEFLDWARRVSACTSLHNPLALVGWNADKRYLGELAARGLPVIPTTYIAPGEAACLPTGGAYVIKPTIGAGARDADVFGPGEEERARAHLARLAQAGRTAMVQPYLAGVEQRGETDLVFFDGRYSHAVCKGAILGTGPRVFRGLYAVEAITGRQPSPAELGAAQAVIDSLPAGPPLYARVDLIPDARGAPMLVELELIEPSLFLGYGEGALGRLVAALAARL